ncbi:transposase [Meiothermus ruber]|uniref:transposase n=1 Tax=Meiothermus ruber TaxID=277 RepID=UPI0007237047|nr:transposase [Meiothermus ruber]GAO75551.1 transposase-like protein [Meiothermus ruber H328]
MVFLFRLLFPELELEVWGLDEHRIGLKPIRRRVWALRGRTPLAQERPRYRWLYVYAFIRPGTGESEYWLLPSVSVEGFQLVLEAFARLRGAGAGKLVLVVLDQAGWHTFGAGGASQGLGAVLSAILLARVAAGRTSLGAHRRGRGQWAGAG